MSNTTYGTPPARPAAVVATTAGGTVRRVSWGAIFAGAVIATALMVFFTTLGIGIGTGVINPATEANPLDGLLTGSAIYTVVTQLISLAVGGYVAARMSGIARSVSAVLHGATVWGVTTVFLAAAAVMGGSAIFGAASNLSSTAASGVSNAVQAVVPDDFSLPDPTELVSSLSMEDLPAPVREGLEERNISVERAQRELTNAFDNVVSEEERTRATEEARSTLTAILANPSNAGAEIEAFFDDLVGGPNAVFSEEDRQEVLTQLETRLGVSPEEAEQVIDSVQAQTEEAIAAAREAIDTAQREAVEAADAAADAVSNTAFLLALASILGLVAAAIGGIVGKPDDMAGDRLHDHA